MTNSEDDKAILELEYLYKIKAKPLKNTKADKTIKLSPAVKRKIGQVYEGEVSVLIEQDLIRRLRSDGHLPPPLGSTELPKRKNPAEATPDPNVVWDSKKQIYRRKTQDDE